MVMGPKTCFYACQLHFFFWMYGYVNIIWGPYCSFFLAPESDALPPGRKLRKFLRKGLFQSIARLLFMMDKSCFMGPKTCFYARRFLFFLWLFLYKNIKGCPWNTFHAAWRSLIVGKSTTIPTPRRKETLLVAIEIALYVGPYERRL